MRPGTYNTAEADLVDGNGDDLPNQFQETIGGVGGSVSVAGFFLDSLTLPTIEGPSITFLNAPVLVTDVTVTDPVTQQSLTLDGDFGSNFLMASINEADLLGSLGRTAGASPDLGNLGQTSSPFDWITFDQPNGILGLDVPGITVTPWPTATASASSLTAGGGFHLHIHRQLCRHDRTNHYGDEPGQQQRAGHRTARIQPVGNGSQRESTRQWLGTHRHV